MAEEEIARLQPELIQLRQELHKNPELSGQEEATAHRLRAYLQQYMPSRLLTRLGAGTGLAAVYEGTEAGPTIMFRADMDALPIQEAKALPIHEVEALHTQEVDALPIQDKNGSGYASQNAGVSHKCGHDGHMAMVAGLAPLLHRHKLSRGKVILLMQPAEETGEGAKALLEDKQFTGLQPDYIFGLHNLPGYPLGQLVLRDGTFCAASKGLRIRLKGHTSHAAEPDKGVSPAGALADLLQRLPQMPQQLPHQDLLLLTLTHAQMGEATFGTSPGEAILQVTLRANLDEEMQLLTNAVEQQTKAVAAQHGLGLELSYHEVFPVTQNCPSAFKMMQRAADTTGYSVHIKPEPFRWSEDFGHYNKLATAGFFGLGSGTTQPNLHNASYDFPDPLIPYGLRMYWALIQEGLRE